MIQAFLQYLLSTRQLPSMVCKASSYILEAHDYPVIDYTLLLSRLALFLISASLVSHSRLELSSVRLNFELAIGLNSAPPISD